jgi:hypothetical protein
MLESTGLKPKFSMSMVAKIALEFNGMKEAEHAGLGR